MIELDYINFELLDILVLMVLPLFTLVSFSFLRYGKGDVTIFYIV